MMTREKFVENIAYFESKGNDPWKHNLEIDVWCDPFMNGKKSDYRCTSLDDGTIFLYDHLTEEWTMKYYLSNAEMALIYSQLMIKWLNIELEKGYNQTIS